MAHYKEREGNLNQIISDLLAGSVIPEKIIVFIDNPAIEFENEYVTIIRSSESFLPNVRFALGMVSGTDYCFFIDDDLSVKGETLANFVSHATTLPNTMLGLEGSILGNTVTPYSNDTSVQRGTLLTKVDVIIRTYFVPTHLIVGGFVMRHRYHDLPKTSLDDVFLSLGNKYFHKETNWVIPVTPESDLVELPDGGVGQSFDGDHYKNRNIVCRKLMDVYE